MKKRTIDRFLFVLAFSFVAVWLIGNLALVRAGSRVARVIDGDTLVLNTGEKIRLLGVDAPDKGVEGADKAAVVVESLTLKKRVWVEGDRYSQDKFGRRLAWLWIGCETIPEFKPDDFMGKIYEQNRGLSYEKWVEDNPSGCKRGILLNEQLVKMGVADVYFAEGEGELMYGESLRQPGVEGKIYSF